MLATFKRIRHINLMSDGSRHGCRDHVYLVLGGFNFEVEKKYRTHLGTMVTLGLEKKQLILAKKTLEKTKHDIPFLYLGISPLWWL